MKPIILSLMLLFISALFLYPKENELNNNNELNYLSDDYTFTNPFRIYSVDKYYMGW